MVGYRRALEVVGLALFFLATGCSEPETTKEYLLVGQVLAVHEDRRELTIKHQDIAGYMPGMTMNFTVASPELMQGRTPGEMISATLTVTNTLARLTSVTHTGVAALPENTNEVALAEGLLAEGDDVPDAAFIDQADRRRSFSEWRGTLTVVTFIYTSCPLPNFCPLMDQNFATLQNALAEDPALKGQVKLVSISFDPTTDTPAVLAAHAAKRHADPTVWTFLTGDRVTLDRFAARFGVSVVRPDTPGEITHNLRTAIVSRDGKIVRLYSGSGWTPGAILADLRTAAATSS